MLCAGKNAAPEFFPHPGARLGLQGSQGQTRGRAWVGLHSVAPGWGAHWDKGPPRAHGALAVAGGVAWAGRAGRVCWVQESQESVLGAHR